MSVSISEVLNNRLLWVELFVCIIHSPPGFTFEVPVETRSSFVLYRSETLISMFTMTRVSEECAGEAVSGTFRWPEALSASAR